MISTIAFEIGGVFLLAALLIYGTMGGFLPRVFHAGKPAGLAIFVLAIAGAVYYFSPEILSAWRDFTASSLPSSPPKATPSLSDVPKVHPIKPRPAPQARTTVVEAPPEAQPVPAPVSPVAIAPAPDPPAPRAEASGDSPYDSGIKRGIKRVGRFLHLRKKDDR
jgi:hypothetical protein